MARRHRLVGPKAYAQPIGSSILRRTRRPQAGAARSLSVLSYKSCVTCMKNAYMTNVPLTQLDRIQHLTCALGCETVEVGSAPNAVRVGIAGPMSGFSSILKTRGGRWHTASRSYTFASRSELEDGIACGFGGPQTSVGRYQHSIGAPESPDDAAWPRTRDHGPGRAQGVSCRSAEALRTATVRCPAASIRCHNNRTSVRVKHRARVLVGCRNLQQLLSMSAIARDLVIRSPSHDLPRVGLNA